MTPDTFWNNVDRDSDPTGCWPWTRSVDSRGYGNLKFNGRMSRAHRVAYELSYQPIPKGEGVHGTVVMHSCDNRLCCNPAHLSIGSHADNMSDMKGKGRRVGITAKARNPRALLTLEQVAAIRSDPRSSRIIAKDYPVQSSAIRRVKSGRSWA